MKTLTFILIALCLTGCFSTITDDELVLIDPVLQPYVDKFYEEAQIRGIKLMAQNEFKIGFGRLPKGVQGRTYYSSKSIVIDSSQWVYNHNAETLIFHEMGHLLLKREHDDSYNGVFIKSLMNSYAQANYSGNLSNHRKYYIDELFNEKTMPPIWN